MEEEAAANKDSVQRCMAGFGENPDGIVWGEGSETNGIGMADTLYDDTH